MTKVILASNQLVTLLRLRQHISAHPEMEIVEEATTKHELASFVKSAQSDLLVVSDEWGEISLLDLLTFVRDADTMLKVLVIGSRESLESPVELFKAGVRGWVLLSEPAFLISKALEAMISGAIFLSPDAISLLQQTVSASAKPNSSLNERETEIIRMIGYGMSNRDIAAELHVCEGTVKNYVVDIRRKLKLSSRNAITLWAWQNNFAGTSESTYLNGTESC